MIMAEVYQLVEEGLGGTSSHAQLYQLHDMCNLMWGGWMRNVGQVR